MKSIAIVTDSNCGMSPTQVKDLGIYMLPMPFFIDDKEYLEDIDMNQSEFFQHLEQNPGCRVSTSQPTPESVTTLWDKLLKDYDEIVHIPMSSGLSASCATAQMLAEDYEGRVFVVDNHRISISQKSSTWDAVALREAGCGAQEIQRELADQLRRLKDPRVSQVGMVSITRVDTTSDLRYARVYVSALNCPDEKGLLKGLKSAAGYLRRELGSRVDLRYTPELQFFIDDSIAYGAHILDMLNHVKPADPRNADIVLPEDRED